MPAAASQRQLTPAIRMGEEATFWRVRSFWYVDIADTRVSPGAAASVTALYAEHALGLVRLAVVMTGDRAAAEDIVQDAFLGLYRRWDHLPGMTAPVAYVRVSVVNGCRTALRRRSRLGLWSGTGAGDNLDEVATAAGSGPAAALAESAEASVLLSEEQRTVVAALRKLPRRQREALVLRYYLDLSIEETAQAMGVSPGTVKSFGVVSHGTFIPLRISKSLAASTVMDITF
jgi:RNA polymerase sigma factor (sigma-70 family)